jgi:peptide/nickel transport system permease protein
MDNWNKIIKTYKKNKLAVISFYFIVFLVFVALCAHLISPYHPGYIDRELKGIPQPPTLKHFFGTDNYGRDIYSRAIYGTQVTLMVGVGAVLIFILIGTLLGAVAGYFGGWIDGLIMRVVDIMLSLPILFIILVIQLLLAPSIYNVIFVIGLTGWAGTARMVRGQALSVKELTFVESARAVGASHWRIITKHIIPNTLAPVIVDATLSIAGTILLESVLSFLGFGVQEPLSSWGSMLNRSQTYMNIAPWMVFFPGSLIVLTVLAFNFLGDGLRDALDPKQRI